MAYKLPCFASFFDYTARTAGITRSLEAFVALRIMRAGENMSGTAFQTHTEVVSH